MKPAGGVVVLTGTDVQHRFVAGELARGPGVAAIVVDHGVPTTFAQRLKSGRRRFGWPGLASRTGLRAVLRATGEASRRAGDVYAILGPSPLPAGVPVFEVHGLNRPESVALLEELRPDVLCVYGTAIVRAAALSTAHLIALNMHTGISPRYRGSDCAFWPLVEREPEWLGATVHECSAAIDGGAVFGTVRATLAAGDGVGAVFARCVQAGAHLYAEVVAEVLAGTAAPVAQDLSTGREYRAAMRGWRAEWAARRALGAGVVRDHVIAAHRLPTSLE